MNKQQHEINFNIFIAYKYQEGRRDVRQELEILQALVKERRFELANARIGLPIVQLPIPIH